MVLIEQVGSSGRRRCDARCYNGKHARCRCICGGINHGKGMGQARRNIAEMAERMIENAQAMGAEIHVPREIMEEITIRRNQMRFSL